MPATCTDRFSIVFKGTSCSCAGCGERIRPFERRLIVNDENGRPIKGERYCDFKECHQLAALNNPEPKAA